MKPPKHLSELSDYRKRQAMTERLRSQLAEKPRVRVKAVGQRVPAVKPVAR